MYKTLTGYYYFFELDMRT